VTDFGPHGVLNATAADNIISYLRDGRLVQNAWTREDQGHHVACLLGAAGNYQSTQDCPATLMPRWLAECTVTLYDGLPQEDANGDLVRRYADMMRRWHVLTPDRWDNVHRAFLVRCIDQAVESVPAFAKTQSYWPAVSAACEQSKTAITSKREGAAKSAALSAASAAESAESAAWSAALSAESAASAAWRAARSAASAAESAALSAESAALSAAWSAARSAASAAWRAARSAASAAKSAALSAAASAAESAARSAAKSAALSAAASAESAALSAARSAASAAWSAALSAEGAAKRAAYKSLFSALLNIIETEIGGMAP
jgi:hypothetical protein